MKTIMRLNRKSLFFITAFAVLMTTIFYFGNVAFDSSAKKAERIIGVTIVAVIMYTQ